LTLAQAWGSLAALAVFVLLLAPPGYWLLLRLDGAPPRARDLGLALGIGFAAMVPLFWLERLLGAPVLLLPAAVIAAAALRGEWRRWADVPLRSLLVMPAVLGLLAAWVNADDVRWDPGGATVRQGFEMADRAFYALVAQELGRDPSPPLQNPFYSGVTFAYSVFPPLAGLLLRVYAGLDMLSVFQVHLSVVSFVFLGLALDRLLLEWGVTSLAARVLTPLLCVLGGDLSFLFPARGVMGAERAAPFLAFVSFSAESLYYNPWMLALPLVAVALVLGSRWLREGGRGRLLLAAWALSALWQTKVFACVPLLLGAFAAAALLRNRRLLMLGAASAALAVPWAVLSTSGGDPLSPQPLRFGLLYPVAQSLAVHPSWEALTAWTAPERGSLARWAAIAAATVLVVAGGLGVRAVGAVALARRFRADTSGSWTWLGASLLAALGLGLLLVGDPLPLNGAQFLILPQLLLWTLTGPWLAASLAGAPLKRLAAATLLAASFASPAVYMARKQWPDRFTRAGSVDRARFAIPADAIAAARWLAAQPGHRAELVADWRGRAADAGGQPAPFLAVLSGRRLLAHGEDFAVSHGLGTERRRMVAEVFDTKDASRAESLLDALGADWLWVDAARPLRYESARLPVRLRSGRVEVRELVPR